MAASKRALLPPILKTVKLPTLSALGKVCRSSVNELKSVRLTIRYQDSSAVEQSGCFLANSSKRFRVMMCIRGYYLIMRYLSIKNISSQIIGGKDRCHPCGNHRKTPGIYCFFSFFNLRFSFGLSWAFFCCSFLPLSLFPLSPISVSPCLNLLFYDLRAGFTSDYLTRCCEQAQVFLSVLQVRPAN